MANGLIRLARAVAAEPDASPAMRTLAHSENITPLAVALLAEGGDVAALRAFARMGTYLGIGIANLLSVLDLPMIVVGGGVASAWPLFAPAMFDAVRRYSVVYRPAEPTQPESMEVYRTFIRPALLGASAGVMGAGLLPLLKFGVRIDARARWIFANPERWPEHVNGRQNRRAAQLQQRGPIPEMP